MSFKRSSASSRRSTHQRSQLSISSPIPSTTLDGPLPYTAYSTSPFDELPLAFSTQRTSFLTEPDAMPLTLATPVSFSQQQLQQHQPASTLNDLPTSPTSLSPAWSPPKPSIRLLFKYTTRRDLVVLLLPAALVSLASGLLTPYMTQVVGDSFNSFSSFPLDVTLATDAQRSQLKADIRVASLSLLAMGVGMIALNTLMAGMWVTVGERNARHIRREVFQKVASRDLTWFDLGMGIADGGEEVAKNKGEGVGAAGLMSKFTRETDEVRIATSQNIGVFLGNLVTCVACLVLALIRSWALALVILAAVPLVVVAQAVVSHVTYPYLSSERRILAEASTKAERAVSSIATVKAFNAQKKEQTDFDTIIEEGRRVLIKLTNVWGANLGFSAVVLSSMFVASFWFGSKLVREGRLSPGDVMTVFFAAVLGCNTLQSLMPMVEHIQKGMAAMASLQAIIEPPPAPEIDLRPLSAAMESHGNQRPFSSSTVTSSGASDQLMDGPHRTSVGTGQAILSASPSQTAFATARPLPGRKVRKMGTLRNIRPLKCHGEFVLRNVTFAYPSRPRIPTLQDVNIFLPSGETTFIVGGSGSGKSTIAHLLLKLYQPSAGTIAMDDQDITVLDGQWMKENIASVQQGCVLFDMSVHQNVAIGLAGSGSRQPDDATREEVVEACTKALIHDFVMGLPDGYDTNLGVSGASLSGGQRQRMAIARAVLRDPSVLILDEATSALDPTSRVLVFEAIKRWRQNRTTIVITHDLSQIVDSDFVYCLKDGMVVEEGFRSDLVRLGGHFSGMADEQSTQPLPVKAELSWDDGEEILDAMLDDDTEEEDRRRTAFDLGLPSTLPASKRSSGSYFDILAGYGNTAARQSHRLSLNSAMGSALAPSSDSSTPSWLVPSRPVILRKSSRESTLSPAIALAGSRNSSYRLSQAPPMPSPGELPYNLSPRGSTLFGNDSTGDLKVRGEAALDRRAGLLYPGSRVDRAVEQAKLKVLASEEEKTRAEKSVVSETFQQNLICVIGRCLRSAPKKPVLGLAFLLTIGHGIITPVWSKYISELMALVATGGRDRTALLTNSLIVIGLSLADGLCIGLSYACFDWVAYRWITTLRSRCFATIMSQDKAWFDLSENSPAALINILIKDADDMVPIITNIPGDFFTAVAMISFGILWAVAIGWKLTLIGVSVVPVFIGAIGFQFVILNRIEIRNKRMREEIAKVFYETVFNIRAVRAMALESVFDAKFDAALRITYSTGLRGAWIQGLGNGLMNGLVYFVESLLFFVIAVLMCEGSYTYARALQVFSLVIFSLTFGAQMLSFLPTVAKAKRAAVDFERLIQLADNEVLEAKGDLRPPVSGYISYSDVHFAYPSRPDVPVLAGVSFDIQPGEFVAIVGGSGSGKSTIATLLQRLYEPTSGSIRIDRHLLANAEANWLREHISVVSQQPALFDMSVTDNIAYGSANVPFAEIERACKSAQVHEFILSLPQGYQTNLGENASLISGGQAQRLQIARTLVKRADILILDECTSALDPDNEAAVLETIMRVRMDRTVLMVTHKLPAMKLCSRILVVADGKIVEDGTFDNLIARGGVFAELARGGAWE